MSIWCACAMEKMRIFSFIQTTNLSYRPLNSDQRNVKDALLMFVMKDQDFYGAKNDYMAEAFVPISDISNATQAPYPKQTHLKLNRPKNAGKLEVSKFR